jgi:DNA-binding CsgD family transcriptional regulator
LKGRHECRTAGVPPDAPCSDGHRLFCEEAWVGIADKLELSERQAEIVRCVLAGQRDGQIAQGLNVSSHTIQTHVQRLHEKLKIRSRVELAARVFAAYRAWRAESLPPAGCPQNTRL